MGFYSFPGKIECLTRATRTEFVYNGSFQEAVGPILAFGQFFSVMPVVGVKTNSASKLKFKWDSCRTIYSVIMFVLLTFYASLTLFITFRRNKIRFEGVGMSMTATTIQLKSKNLIFLLFLSTVPLIFYASAFYGLFRFIILAKKWPSLMLLWESVENNLPKWQYQTEKRKLAYQIKITAFIVLFCSFGMLYSFELKHSNGKYSLLI